MKLSIGSDHGGYAYKEAVKEHLLSQGHEVIDCGCFGTESVDYPEFGIKAAELVRDGEADRGIVICTTGIGMSIAANKVRGIRCALCGDLTSAEMTMFWQWERELFRSLWHWRSRTSGFRLSLKAEDTQEESELLPLMRRGRSKYESNRY